MNSTCDVLIIGGGIIGLSIALELRLRGAAVTVLSRDFQQAASQAAAGMLAPGAEALPPSPLMDLCLQSLDLYSDWIDKLEGISGLQAGYWNCGILAPKFAVEVSEDRISEDRVSEDRVSEDRVSEDTPAQAGSPPTAPTTAHITTLTPDTRIWLNHAAIHNLQPGLSPEVMGGWWFPEEGQVDSRALVQALRQAVQSLGAILQEGVTVQTIRQQRGQVVGVKTTAGEWQAGHYILATGAWAQELLPLPVQPRKGQMLSVRVPEPCLELPLNRVLYGEEIYIVPRRTGQIVLGATSESVGFMPYNTPNGLQKLLQGATRLYPRLGELPIQEAWWGFRPTTPDELPLLGASLCDNLTFATGHHRNGILLAPITAQLIAAAVWDQQIDPLLEHFSWQRFYAPPAPLPLPNAKLNPDPNQPNQLPFSSPISAMLQSAAPTTPLAPVLPSVPAFTDPNPLVIAGRTFHSRLMTGTGKYRNFDQMRQSITASQCEIVTVAVRRVQTQAPGHEGLAEAIDWSKIWMLPNTAGCKTAEEAIRVARLGREMAKLLGQEDNNFVKLEVIPDAKYLLPDPIGTLEAAEQLVKEGFAVLPYINADPLLAKRLEEAGCATVMPLGSPIGSGQGIKNTANIQIIIETCQVPVVVDAGIGTPSEAAQAMEMGADALLINTAIAQAENPAMMAAAMGMAATAGRWAYLAGRIPVKSYASASSPVTGTITG